MSLFIISVFMGCQVAFTQDEQLTFWAYHNLLDCVSDDSANIAFEFIEF
jgi:hypothetical protein